MGYVVYTATTSQTGSSASSIKNYIENAYDNFDPAPEYERQQVQIFSGSETLQTSFTHAFIYASGNVSYKL